MRASFVLLLLGPAVVYMFPHQGQGMAPVQECETRLSFVSMEVSSALLHTICKKSNETLLFLDWGGRSRSETVEGFCNSFELNIGHVFLNQPIDSPTITLRLTHSGRTLDAVKVAVLTADLLQQYRISVWGNRNTRFLLAVAKNCRSFHQTVPGRHVLPTALPSGAIVSPDSSEPKPSYSSTIPEYVLPNRLHSPDEGGFYSYPNTRHSKQQPATSTSSVSNGPRPRDFFRMSLDTQASTSEVSLLREAGTIVKDAAMSTTPESLELAKLRWMEEKRILFEQKMELLRSRYPVYDDVTQAGQSTLNKDSTSQLYEDVVTPTAPTSSHVGDSRDAVSPGLISWEKSSFLFGSDVFGTEDIRPTNQSSSTTSRNPLVNPELTSPNMRMGDFRTDSVDLNIGTVNNLTSTLSIVQKKLLDRLSHSKTIRFEKSTVDSSDPATEASVVDRRSSSTKKPASFSLQDVKSFADVVSQSTSTPSRGRVASSPEKLAVRASTNTAANISLTNFPGVIPAAGIILARKVTSTPEVIPALNISSRSPAPTAGDGSKVLLNLEAGQQPDMIEKLDHYIESIVDSADQVQGKETGHLGDLISDSKKEGENHQAGAAVPESLLSLLKSPDATSQAANRTKDSLDPRVRGSAGDKPKVVNAKYSLRATTESYQPAASHRPPDQIQPVSDEGVLERFLMKPNLLSGQRSSSSLLQSESTQDKLELNSITSSLSPLTETITLPLTDPPTVSPTDDQVIDSADPVDLVTGTSFKPENHGAGAQPVSTNGLEADLQMKSGQVLAQELSAVQSHLSPVFLQSSDTSDAAINLIENATGVDDLFTGSLAPDPRPDPETPGSSSLPPQADRDEKEEKEIMWPIIAAVIIGVPAVIVVVIALVVLQRKRLSDPVPFSPLKLAAARLRPAF